jgi:Uma2 family endonuclease
MAATRTIARRMGLDEYFALELADDSRTELVYGECVVSPPPAEEHSDFVHALGEVLKRWTKHHKLGKVAIEVHMVLDKRLSLAYEPDITFVAAENDARRKKGRINGPADLCIEVFSPSERPWLRNRKFADYESYGVKWYWGIDPDPAEPRLEEYELVQSAYVCRAEIAGNAWFQPQIFPGLSFRLPPLMVHDLRGAVKGKAKRLM